jgi:proline iminopeptidase
MSDPTLTRRTLGLAVLASASLLGASLPATAEEKKHERKTGWVQTKQGKLRYETLGSGPSAIIAIAGGPGGSLRSLGTAIDPLADRFTVVYFDNLGRGYSDDLPAGVSHSPQRDAEDVEALRAALGFEKVTVFGHSYGGFAALAYAGAQGRRLEKLVLSSTGYSHRSWQANIDSVARFFELQYPEIWEQMMALHAKGVMSSAPEFTALIDKTDMDSLYWYDRKNKALRPPATDPKEKFRPAVYNGMLGPDPEMVVGGAIAGFDASETLRTLKCPLLVTAGRFDRVAMPAVAWEMHKLAPAGRSQLAIYDKSGHAPWAEERGAYLEKLRAFLG